MHIMYFKEVEYGKQHCEQSKKKKTTHTKRLSQDRFSIVIQWALFWNESEISN